MKILHVITSLSIGGAEHLMVDLLPRLRDLGNEVEIALFDSKRTDFYSALEDTDIKIHGFSEVDSVYNIKNIIRLKTLMKDFDIIHTHNTACQMFAALARRKNDVLVTTEHSTSNRRRAYAMLRPLDKWMYNQYNKIICISKPAEDSLKAYLGKDYPIITIHNGINLTRFSSANEIDIGLSGYRLITMVAGFRYEKDQSTLIRSLKYLPNDYHVVLVGDGEYRVKIESLVSELRLNQRVHLLGFRNDVPQILKSSDIIVMSSHREGLSLSNVEGMSSGKPFIASDVEGLREVTEGYGLLFPHGDEKDLAKKILMLMNNRPYYDEVASRCQKRAQQYDISQMVEEYNNVYKELIGR